MSALESMQRAAPGIPTPSAQGNLIENVRFANMSARMDALEQSVHQSAPVASQASSTDRGLPVDVSPEERTRREESQARTQFATFEASIQNEARDRRAEMQFTDVVQNIVGLNGLENVKVEDVKCTARLCRLDVSTSGDVMTEAGLMLQRLDHAKPHGGMWMNTVLGGPEHAIVFAAPYGADLPAVSSGIEDTR
ncbi:MAG TPA: hypothetical protein VHC69_13140 [Polyangiaceae bacterium]|nr:hypothetical protein [Polyangiaceae bacterium]